MRNSFVDELFKEYSFNVVNITCNWKLVPLMEIEPVINLLDAI